VILLNQFTTNCPFETIWKLHFLDQAGLGQALKTKFVVTRAQSRETVAYYGGRGGGGGGKSGGGGGALLSFFLLA
jgi:hypothetical protein